MATPGLAVSSSAHSWREETPRAGLWGRLVRGLRKLRWRADWEERLGRDWAEAIFEIEVTDRYFAKQGRSVGRLILDDTLSVYLKRHYRLPRRHGLLAILFPGAAWSPGWQEARHLQWAKEQGIPVPEVVAAGEFVGAGGTLRSFLAIEELTDMLPLHEAVPHASRLLSGHDFTRWKAGLVKEMARLTRILHDRRHFHKDLYLCHFYVRRDDCGRLPEWIGRVHMIDFHRLAHHPLTFAWWRVKDLGQLHYSSNVEGVTPRDRLRFLRAYMGTKRRTFLGWVVKLRGGLYRQHNRKRKISRSVQPAKEHMDHGP